MWSETSWLRAILYVVLLFSLINGVVTQNATAAVVGVIALAGLATSSSVLELAERKAKQAEQSDRRSASA